MNFLWIIKVIAFIFVLNIQFLIHLSDFLNLLDQASISGKSRGTGAKAPKTQITASWTAG